MDILLVKVYGYNVTSLSKLLRSTVGISILIKYIDRGWLHRILLPIHSVHAAEQRRIRMSSITLSLRGARARKKMVSDSLDSWPRRLQSPTFIKAEGNEREHHFWSRTNQSTGEPFGDLQYDIHCVASARSWCFVMFYFQAWESRREGYWLTVYAKLCVHRKSLTIRLLK